MANIKHQYGLGLRSKHYDYILEHKPQLDFFEIISENFMESQGRPREMLDKIRAHYAIITHGVSLSIGSTDPLNKTYLTALKKFVDEINPEIISDHLCWTGINGHNTHDLLPLPLTSESLEHTVNRTKQVQDFLGRKILIENPSTYLTFKADYIPEYEFMAQLAEKADCGILLDVNNIFVSSFNHRLNAKKYIDAIPFSRVGQIHLAGHANKKTHIVDTHDDFVNDEVWKLYQYAINKAESSIKIMVEWDGNIPDFPVLAAEIGKARAVSTKHGEWKFADNNYQNNPSNHNLKTLQTNLQSAIHSGDLDGADMWILPKENFAPDEQLAVYVAAYRLRIHDSIIDDYEFTRKYLGADNFTMLIRNYIESTPSEFYDMAQFTSQFADWLGAQNIPEFAKELADLERNIAVCYDMKACEAATQIHFAGVSPESFLELKLKPRTASILRSYNNDVNSFVSEKSPDNEAKIHPILVYRKTDKVFRLALDEAEYEILKAFEAGKTIAEAITKTQEKLDISEEEIATKLQNYFAKWIANEVLQAF